MGKRVYFILWAVVCILYSICLYSDHKLTMYICSVYLWLGVKNLSKLPTDSTKKLTDMREGVPKIWKNCRRCLWMDPKAKFSLETNELNLPFQDSNGLAPKVHESIKFLFL